MELLQTIWFLLIVFLLLGYAVLDGFDLGIGILTPVLAKKEEEKRVLFNAVGPVWDGNEVWLIAAGTSLFAAFPSVYATVFSGFYLALMLVLFALIFRAVSLEFWSFDRQNRKLWSATFVVGSLLPSFLYGVALGNIIQGIPLNSHLDFSGNFFTLLRPFPLAAGLLSLCAILLQGSTYGALKTEAEVQGRARWVTSRLWLAFMVVFLLNILLAILSVEGLAERIVGWLFVLIVLLGWGLMKYFLTRGKDAAVFLSSSLIHVGLWGIIAAIQFPYLVRASNNPAYHLTIYNASSGPLSLKVMTIIALVGMPIVIAYSIYVHRVFRGKVKLDSPGS